jgi:hypothetical protein
MDAVFFIFFGFVFSFLSKYVDICIVLLDRIKSFHLRLIRVLSHPIPFHSSLAVSPPSQGWKKVPHETVKSIRFRRGVLS